MSELNGWEQAPEALRQLAAKLTAEINADYFGRSPSYRYFEWKHEMYCWTTEPLNGKFVCWTYKPYGKGSRTNPTKWRAVERVEFARRRIAKARAYSRYLKAKEREEQ